VTDSADIKGNRKGHIIGSVIGWVIRIFGMTYRVEVEDNAGVGELGREPIIHVVWHNRIFAATYLWRLTSSHQPLVALTSASKDGAILAAAVGVVGVQVARGSSSRRGAAALVTLRKALKAHKDVYITPDGPRGPMYELQAGTLKLAQASGVPIVVKQIRLHDYWELKTWDRLRIPKPFSHVTLRYDEPIYIPKGLCDEEFEELRVRIERQMSEFND